MVSSLIGVFVGISFVLGYIPQLNNLLKALFNNKTAEGVSVTFWYLISLALALTYSNFNSTDSSLWVIVPQGLNASMAFLILVTVIMIRFNLVHSLVYSIGLGLSIYAISQLLPTDIAQTVATICIVVAYFTQIYHLYKSKTAEGLSILLFLFIALSLALMTVNIFITGSYSYGGVTEIVNLIMVLVIVFLIWRYNRKGEKNL